MEIKTKKSGCWDLVSLGEVLLRFDSGEERIHATRSFKVWDGGGEYNVAKNLAKTFRLKTTIVTALADNSLGRLAEDFIWHGGVDSSQILWRETDGKSERTRNGLYFIERGFGHRAPSSCFDRGNTAVSQLKIGDVDWENIFGSKNGSRWFHTGGVFVGLSETTPEVALEAMKTARKNGVIVSFDLNYRDSLWREKGGREAANILNRELLSFVDVVLGVPNFDASFDNFDESDFRDACENLIKDFPNLQVVVSTLRKVKNANSHDLSATCFVNGKVFKAKNYENINVLDRVGSGDAFASGLIYGLLNERGAAFSVECGLANAILAMTTPGDNSMATLNEIEQFVKGSNANVLR